MQKRAFRECCSGKLQTMYPNFINQAHSYLCKTIVSFVSLNFRLVVHSIHSISEAETVCKCLLLLLLQRMLICPHSN